MLVKGAPAGLCHKVDFLSLPCSSQGTLLMIDTWAPSQYKNIFLGMQISIMKIRRLIFIMEIPILVRRHVYFETAPWCLYFCFHTFLWLSFWEGCVIIFCHFIEIDTRLAKFYFLLSFWQNVGLLFISLFTTEYLNVLSLSSSNRRHKASHYNDVIMSTMASQIIRLTIVYSTVYSGADQREHQSSASLAFVLGIHQWPVNSPHKWPATRKMFPSSWAIV